MKRRLALRFPLGRGGKLCEALDASHTFSAIDSISLDEIEKLSSDVVYLAKAIPCRLFNINNILDIIVNIADNSAQGSLTWKRITKNDYAVHYINFCGIKLRYIAILQHSAILVESKGKRWLLLFYCSDFMSFREYLEKLDFSYGNVSTRLAGFPVTDALMGLKANIILFYTYWSPSAGSPFLQEVERYSLLYKASSETDRQEPRSRVEIIVGASRSSYLKEIAPAGYTVLKVRPAYLQLDSSLFSELLFALLGMSVSVNEEGVYRLLPNREIIETVVNSFPQAIEKNKHFMNFLRRLLQYTHSPQGG